MVVDVGLRRVVLLFPTDDDEYSNSCSAPHWCFDCFDSAFVFEIVELPHGFWIVANLEVLCSEVGS